MEKLKELASAQGAGKMRMELREIERPTATPEPDQRELVPGVFDPTTTAVDPQFPGPSESVKLDSELSGADVTCDSQLVVDGVAFVSWLDESSAVVRMAVRMAANEHQRAWVKSLVFTGDVKTPVGASLG